MLVTFALNIFTPYRSYNILYNIQSENSNGANVRLRPHRFDLAILRSMAISAHHLWMTSDNSGEATTEQQRLEDQARWALYEKTGRAFGNDQVSAWLASIGADNEKPCPG